jgi:PAS domain S-box-containing protein
MYVVTGVAIAFMGGSMRVSQRRAEEGVRQAEQERERLEREVRERRRAEVAERSQRERLDATLAGVGDGVIVTDARGRVVSLNPVAEALTGWTTADAEGRSLKEVFRIRDVATQLTDELPVVEVIQEGVAHQPESTELVSRDGTSRAIEHCTSPIKDDRGWVTGVVIVVRDVTERKKAEEALRASEGRFRLLVEAMPQIAWITRPDRSVEYMNRRWFDFTGMAPEALDVPGGWQSALHPDDVDRVE